MTPPLIKRFLISLNEHKWLGFFGFAACVAGSAFFALQPSPTSEAKYRVTGSLSLTNPPADFNASGKLVQTLARKIEPENILTSKLLSQVAEKSGLSLNQIETSLNRKFLVIQFPQNEKTQFINIEYNNAQDTHQSQLLVKVLMEEMVEQSRLLDTIFLSNKIGALEKGWSEVKVNLRKAEEELYQYLTKEGTALLAFKDSSLSSEITTTKLKQEEIKHTIEKIATQIKLLSKRLGLNSEQAYTAAALSSDPTIANLDAIGSEGLSIRSSKEIGTSIDLDASKQQLANKIVALKNQKEGLDNQLKSLEKIEKELKNQYEKFPDKQLQQTRLVQEVELQRALYKKILERLVDAKAAEAETIGSLIIVRPASVQEIPLSPLSKISPLLTILAGAGLGVLVAGGIIFLFAKVDDRLHTSQELRDALAQRELMILGELPYVVNIDTKGEETPILKNSNPFYLHDYERFRSNIRRLGSNSSKIILITSIANGEGKSVSAYNLAIASANVGKRTLLIEADLRSPSQAEYLEVNPAPEANLEPLRYYGERSDAVYLVPEVDNLYIVPSPGPLEQAAAIVESDELRRLIEETRGRFDMVVIDTPSLSICNDVLLLEPLADAIVLVTRPGVTRASTLTKAINQLLEAKSSLLGAVINDVNNLLTTSEFSPQKRGRMRGRSEVRS